ncbi:MAG: phosphate ABC transporter substrate-binding protein [Anaerolineae bacterium]|jgi:phosphate transport system substrate-binding protein
MDGISRLRVTFFAVLLWLVPASLLVACGEPLATPEPVFLRADGSTSMAPLVLELAQAYGEQYPLVSLDVHGPGTQYGLDALRAGEVDLALASWLPADLAPDWRSTAIARDGISVIVHPDNPIDGLGLLQLQDLFGGRVYEWQALGGAPGGELVQAVSREEGSGTRSAFEALVLQDLALTPLAIVAPSSQAMVDYVASHPESIGYVSMGHTTPDVKVLKIEGGLPTSQAVGEGSYALTRELWLVVAESPPQAVEDFVDFVLGAAGQQIVGRRYGRIK